MLLGGCAVVPDAGPLPVTPPAAVQAADGTSLDGVLVGSGPAGVVLVHQYPSDLCGFWPFADYLAKRGLRAFAIEAVGAVSIIITVSHLAMQRFDHVEQTFDQRLPDMRQFVDERGPVHLVPRREVQQIHRGERPLAIDPFHEIDRQRHHRHTYLWKIDRGAENFLCVRQFLRRKLAIRPGEPFQDQRNGEREGAAARAEPEEGSRHGAALPQPLRRAARG